MDQPASARESRRRLALPSRVKARKVRRDGPGSRFRARAIQDPSDADEP